MRKKIQETFDILRGQNQKGLIGYVTAGDPNLSILPEILLSLQSGGVDVIEIGIPFSDPLADGPVIQRAAERALAKGFKVTALFEVLKELQGITTPLAFLVYYNTIFKYGEERFLRQCQEVGVEGLIIPDLPFEEGIAFVEKAKTYGVIQIPLVTPVSNRRMEKIVGAGEGFVYCVSSLGVTGVRQKLQLNVENYLGEVREYTKLPLCLGFGIGTPEMAAELAPYCDGVIVGSVLVDMVAKLESGEKCLEDVEELVRGFKSAI